MKEQNIFILIELCAWLAIIFFIAYLAYYVLAVLFSLDVLEKITPWFLERNREIKEFMPGSFR